ncbi:2-dehydropantoate 2-reductase [Pseudomonas azotoformans]|uniref:2-dehydropantoate 2-reductase n=1 Tax=Pseudomonas azotoformans TaxID=47878 RepID=A0A1V2JQM7_PSEAZ|nr:2-dehydropantoate 2-reductase [Pseudomonas azotoformans]OIN47225.1 2-dehydropantoate 2-reductase [Pseudomonas azotoformans]ONH47126.1 2-dehydropantoate 2-reductase [Pseudomonas azotoformans]SDM76029.1 2-dehydropantoate 2-reductase [Pseudomonas azotoformans]
MRITVIGAGAIGGFLACKLFAAGHEVNVIARGASLAAIGEQGLMLHTGDELLTARVCATCIPEELGIQDLVIFAVKAPALPTAVASAKALIGPQTVVISALNGLPWWFFLKSTQALSGLRLETVDPHGVIEQAIPIDTVVGCVVFPSCTVLSPGVIKHMSGSRIVFGEPAGGDSERVETLTKVFREAGFDAHAHANVREEIWLKLLGNACFNPVSLLVGRATDEMIDDPFLHTVFINMMDELLDLGRQLGLAPEIDPKQRIAITRKLGKVKTSMLQDVEGRKPVELEAILGSVVAAADRVGAPIPCTRTTYALARMQAMTLGLLPG